jgi:hypothetical protein
LTYSNLREQDQEEGVSDRKIKKNQTRMAISRNDLVHPMPKHKRVNLTYVKGGTMVALIGEDYFFRLSSGDQDTLAQD